VGADLAGGGPGGIQPTVSGYPESIL
jgi:hypothetical protein